MANYLELNKIDIADGPGVRVSLYMSGCPFHCEGCHSPQSWNFKAGQLFTDAVIDTTLDYMNNSFITGFSVLGGEPLAHSNRQAVLDTVSAVKTAYPEKDIWMWTGYDWEDLLKDEDSTLKNILKYIDVIVVGRFILAERDISDANRWRGSKNQRVIDVQSSLATNTTVYVKGIPNNN